MVETSTPDASTAVVSLVVEADPDTVFTAFVDPEELAGWFWPEVFAAHYDTDPRPGGRFSFRSTGLPDQHNLGVRGIYGKISRPELLTFIWSSDHDTSPATQVVVTIGPVRQGSKVVVTHSNNSSRRQRDDNLTSWHDSLARLPAHLNIGQPLLEDA